jgi:ubiquinone/menaquinone biosynthesis C-methylase UbiE
MYSEEYLACNESQMNYVIEHLSGANGPIVDLASGRGYLVEKLIQRLDQHVVITDFSLPVLRRDSRWLEFNGWSERASLLAFDARRTPLKDGVIKNLTSNLGLPNVENPGEVLNELRRIVGGKFLAIMHFYPPEDRENADAIREIGLTSFTYRQTTLQGFDEAGWRVKLANRCAGRAAPTPTGVVLKGAAIDALPVAETTLEWCTLEAN